jgi:oxygen-independent coproporphyrinogen-3 oxidase
MAGIYIHIPFCKQACHYCDFHFSTSLANRVELLKALMQEIRLQKDFLNGQTIETIYFGGGTPSLLSGEEINRVMNEITHIHQVSRDAEITLEANPDDLDLAKLKLLKQTPVNRFSIGIQSFFDDDLTWMNRAHRASEAEGSVKRAQDAGFENITIDLIYGYPLLTDQKWRQNLARVFELEVPHVSCYAMTVEPRTALASFIRNKKQPPINDEQSSEQFVQLMDAMETQGFEHYEISNFCLPGHYSRHNTSYWKGIKYVGIGPSAHSYDGEKRQWNIANNPKYIQEILKNKIPSETELLTEENRLNEYIMTSLRTQWGLHLEHLNSIARGAAESLLKEAEKFREKHWIIQKEQTIYLTKAGKLYADHIASELFF